MSMQVLSKNSVTDVFPNLKKITTSALFFLLTACAAVGPDYKEPEIAVPDAWTNAVINEVNSNVSLEQWWTTFNDPILDSLLERAKKSKS